MKDTHEIKMMTPFTEVLLVVMALGLGVAIYRLINGLGATTNLSDNFPWGLWIGFDLLGGVAMAAGGFIIAGTVYLLHWEKYRPIVRPAVLTAFLGYLLAVVALFFDLGQPFRIWHPAFMWQYHSVMWVVAMHVIFYTLTLGVEFSPMLFEKLKLTGLLRFVKKIMVGVVLFGVMLSVLHQSSLGALYLIMVNKLSPLWYNPLIPYFFLVSAVAMGLNMVSLESIISAKAFKHAPHMDILQGLARGSIIALVLYLAMKVIYLINGAGLAAIFDGSMEANIYLLEMVATNVRQSTGGLLIVNILVIGGVLLNRMSIAVFGMYEYSRAQGGSYTPSLMEFTLTLAIVAFGIFLFKVVAKYLTLFPEAEMQI
jgi:Ni/Fe-hydrogenase subunit HybB-like protein